MESIRIFLKKHIVLAIAVVLIVLVAGGYALGYRIGPGGIARVGTVTLSNLPIGTTVYVEQMLKTTVRKEGVVKLELVPGNHSLIVSAPNDYPWSSLVAVTSGMETAVTPILIKMKVDVTKLSDADAAAAVTAITSSALPTPANPLKVAGGCANVYVSNNQIIETVATSTPGCTPPPYLCTNGACEPTIIFSPVSPLTNVFAYPGRKDALAIAFSGTLYAIALDPTSPQFFAPLVRGSNIKFGQLSDGAIVVQDSTTVSKLGL